MLDFGLEGSKFEQYFLRKQFSNLPTKRIFRIKMASQVANPSATDSPKTILYGKKTLICMFNLFMLQRYIIFLIKTTKKTKKLYEMIKKVNLIEIKK